MSKSVDPLSRSVLCYTATGGWDVQQWYLKDAARSLLTSLQSSFVLCDQLPQTWRHVSVEALALCNKLVAAWHLLGQLLQDIKPNGLIFAMSGRTYFQGDLLPFQSCQNSCSTGFVARATDYSHMKL